MKTKIAKIVFSGLFAAIIFFSGTHNVSADSNMDLIFQIQQVKQQIIILQIQLIQMRIADLQEQLRQITSGSANAFIDILYPNGGEKLENGKSYYIRWESKGVKNLNIELVTPENGTTIARNVTAADGRYSWYTDNISGNDYRIKIFDSSNSSVSDTSNAKFLVFDNSDGNRCSDGTIIGKCSTEKPKLCFDEELDLVDACHSCGCPSGLHCASNSKCQ